eukprot:GHVU01117433.1.p1 GENE.GHVU01117433.1~~GHVU01117433.1.p1  ORF type:complete len:364 (+),score=50.50 GHVU01117433.1:906-1997(+)
MRAAVFKTPETPHSNSSCAPEPIPPFMMLDPKKRLHCLVRGVTDEDPAAHKAASAALQLMFKEAGSMQALIDRLSTIPAAAADGPAVRGSIIASQPSSGCPQSPPVVVGCPPDSHDDPMMVAAGSSTPTRDGPPPGIPADGADLPEVDRLTTWEALGEVLLLRLVSSWNETKLKRQIVIETGVELLPTSPPSLAASVFVALPLSRALALKVLLAALYKLDGAASVRVDGTGIADAIGKAFEECDRLRLLLGVCTLLDTDEDQETNVLKLVQHFIAHEVFAIEMPSLSASTPELCEYLELDFEAHAFHRRNPFMECFTFLRRILHASTNCCGVILNGSLPRDQVEVRVRQSVCLSACECARVCA